LTLRRLILILAIPVALAILWTAGRAAWQRFVPAAERATTAQSPRVTIDKRPVNFTNRIFDPARPPADMPPLGFGEQAQCDSNFASSAMVSGRFRQTDAAHATLTVVGVKITLGLDITIWLPVSVTQQVLDHEEGHRQISEHYYATADQLAQRIAASYIGKEVAVSGANLEAELNKALQEIGAEITNEYSRQLNPEPTQLRYDAITDHSRNNIAAQDAVAQALRES
jgi:hypothetical protein